MKTRDLSPIAGILAAMLLLSGCEQADPYRREGMWRPEGVVNANLAAQLANPRDLVRGRGDPGPVYRESTTSLTKLWAGTPTLGAQPSQSGSGPGASAGSGAAGGGGSSPK